MKITGYVLYLLFIPFLTVIVLQFGMNLYEMVWLVFYFPVFLLAWTLFENFDKVKKKKHIPIKVNLGFTRTLIAFSLLVLTLFIVLNSIAFTFQLEEQRVNQENSWNDFYCKYHGYTGYYPVMKSLFIPSTWSLDGNCCFIGQPLDSFCMNINCVGSRLYFGPAGTGEFFIVMNLTINGTIGSGEVLRGSLEV